MHIRVLLLLFIFFSILFSIGNAHAQNFSKWLSEQESYSKSRLRMSISSSGATPGAIMASPSTANPNYYFHWVRDAAIVAREMVELYRQAKNSDDKKFWETELLNFVAFSRQNQLTDNWSGAADSLGLGEPKFLMNGDSFNEGWGRPQSDGPALRAQALIQFAQTLMKQGRHDAVLKYLYSPQMPAKSVIKADLEYVANHWRSPTFDLWEEVSGDHFFTRLVQYTALIDGAGLAESLGDSAAAYWYRWQAAEIKNTFIHFWDEKKGYYLATINSDRIEKFKPSNLDTAIVLGVINSKVFSMSDERIVKTVARLEASFQHFAINADKNLAPAMGRYPEDSYDGHKTESLGNPWFLTTHAFAEYYYALANEIDAEWARQRGDLYFIRSMRHTSSDHSQAEEMNRDTGYQQGAEHLTWSYASFLSALRQRKNFKGAIK